MFGRLWEAHSVVFYEVLRLLGGPVTNEVRTLVGSAREGSFAFPGQSLGSGFSLSGRPLGFNRGHDSAGSADFLCRKTRGILLGGLKNWTKMCSGRRNSAFYSGILGGVYGCCAPECTQ